MPTENISDNNDEIKSINKCKWCEKEIATTENLCFPEDAQCTIYYNALTNRMALDYRKPEEALEYDRISVKNFVDSRKKNNV